MFSEAWNICLVFNVVTTLKDFENIFSKHKKKNQELVRMK